MLNYLMAFVNPHDIPECVAEDRLIRTEGPESKSPASEHLCIHLARIKLATFSV